MARRPVRLVRGPARRAEALAACQYAIDRLKQIVPIWKKEVGVGGESWVEGPQVAYEGR